jgi:D-3-phosphoglycerate dehydrogenase
VAVLLRAFDCKILAHDILDFPEFYGRYQVTPVGLEELLRRSDIVTLHLPLDDSTRNMLSAEKLSLMNPEAHLINMARGNIVDEEKLKEMLQHNRLAGAAFDVFAQEPPADRELVNLPNVLVTPHIGGSTEEAILNMGLAAINGLDNARPVQEILRELHRSL